MPNTKVITEDTGVSIVTSTNKLRFMNNIFFNFDNQKWLQKELILILNNDLLNLTEWKKYAEKYNNVSLYQLPEHKSLGACLNLGVKKAKYDFIAKFDDDDYYGPLYLWEELQAFRETGADLVGKRSYFMYMPVRKLLLLRFPSHENCWTRLVHGATILAKREVFEAVSFVDRPVGTDLQFFLDCRKKRFRFYSTSRFNYTYFRRDYRYHTWKANLQYLFNTSQRVAVTSDYREYADQSPSMGQVKTGLPSITAIDLKPALIYSPYLARITAVHGLLPYTWKAGQLPPGLRLTEDGILCGIPNEIGTFDINMIVTDSRGLSVHKSYTITVIGLLPVPSTSGNDPE